MLSWNFNDFISEEKKKILNKTKKNIHYGRVWAHFKFQSHRLPTEQFSDEQTSRGEKYELNMTQKDGF